MRNGQNNKRMRNRNNNNNRRGQNPMTRVFESNGPDIKIRGTASHVAEKYVQLARDARSSGDPVAAENYYQLLLRGGGQAEIVAMTISMSRVAGDRAPDNL